MTEYATVEDVIVLFRPLSGEETEKAMALIPIVSAQLRERARACGNNLDTMMTADADLIDIAKSVVVDVVARNLMTPTSGAPMTQTSESALGYSFSGTFLNPGGGLFIKESEYRRLGLKRQKVSVIDLWPQD